MRLYLVLIAFFSIAIAPTTVRAWDLRVPSILSQSGSQSEHNKNVERDYKEVTKWQQDAGLVSKPRGPGLMEYFWPFVLAGALLAIYAIFQSVPAKYRERAILGAVVIVMGALGLRVYSIESEKSNNKSERAADQDRRNAATAAYKTVFKENAESIRRLFNGDDPRFLAGEKSKEQLQKMPGVEHGPIYNSKYSQLLCRDWFPCINMIFPKNHPISVGIVNVHFHYCKTKAKEEILTGFGFSYNELYNLAQYEAAKAGLLDAGIIASPYVTVSKDRKMAYIDSPTGFDAKTLGQGQGLSIIWSKVGDKGKDLCGNTSFED